MKEKKAQQEARNWCFDGSAGDAAGAGSDQAYTAARLFASAWGRPVAASTGPAYKGYRGIRA